MIIQNFTVIIFELFRDIINNQHIHQGVKWKVSHLRDRQPVSWLTGRLLPGEDLEQSLMRFTGGAAPKLGPSRRPRAGLC